MNGRSERRAQTLNELVAFIGVFVVIVSFAGPAVRRATDVAEASTRLCRASQTAEIAIGLVGSDLRQASIVTYDPAGLGSAAKTWPGGFRLAVRFPDHTAAAYFMQDGALVRYSLAEGLETPMSEKCLRWVMRKDFEQFNVAPVAGDAGLYRIDVAIRIRKPVGRDMQAREQIAHFTTAVRLRVGGSP